MITPEAIARYLPKKKSGNVPEKISGHSAEITCKNSLKVDAKNFALNAAYL